MHIPSTTRRDVVFDFAGQNLYISNSTGIVQTFNLSTLTFGTSYNVGGSLNGLDIARDDSFLLVAQNNTTGTEGTFHRVALPSGSVTNINYTRASGENGAWDVAIGSNGLAMVTTQFGGSGTVPVRQIDLTTNAISIRTDRGSVSQNTQIHRGADGTRLFFMQPNDQSIFTYSAPSNTFISSVNVGIFLDGASGATNRNGDLVALRASGATTTVYAGIDLNFVRSVTGIDSGVAFDASNDILYGVNSSADQIIAFSTQTFGELFRLDIGENVFSSATQFGNGVLVASPDGHWLALQTPSGIRLLAIPTTFPSPTPTPTATPTPTPGGNVLIPSAIRRDMVFDFSGQNLYISNLTGTVRKFNLSTLRFETIYQPGGTLNGMDIARDNSFVLVAQDKTTATEGTFHKIDLATGSITNINYTRAPNETGAWDVAIGSNGLALVTTQFGGSGWVPLRQIDLTTNAITIRNDAPGSGSFGEVRQYTQVHRSADGTRLFLMEGNVSNGPSFTYSALSNTFGPHVDLNSFITGAVNRDGSLVGVGVFSGQSTLRAAPSLSLVQSFPAINRAVAFNAASDTLYGVTATTNQIIAYNTITFAELFRLNIGEDMFSPDFQFGSGRLVASADGRWLALGTPSGIRLFPLPEPPPTPTPGPTPTPTATPTPTSTPNPTSTPAPTATPGQLGNISTRLRVETADNVLIGGFIISGTQPKKVIVRAIGPSLTGFGVPGALDNPVLELHDSSQTIASNDDWMDAPNRQEIIDSGLAPTHNLESAILITLPAGNAAYTAIVRGVNQGTGIGLIEAYDLDRTVDAKLANIATRGFVQTGDNVMIGGFIVVGNTPKRVIVRAIGPSLTVVPNRLANPALELRDGNGAVVESNDNWMDAPDRQEIIDSALAPTSDLESAILATLPANNSGYTAIVSGVNGTTGVAVVEVYSLP